MSLLLDDREAQTSLMIDDQIRLNIEEIADKLEYEEKVAFLGDPALEETLMCAQCIGECKIF